MDKLLLYIKIVVNFLIVMIGAALLIFLLPQLLRFFMPFVIGWIIALIANPLVRFLEKKVKIHRKHSSAIILILVILVILGAIILLLSSLVREVSALAADLPVIIANIREHYNNATLEIQQITKTLPVSLQEMISRLVTTAGDYASNLVDNFEMPSMQETGNIAQNVAEGFLALIVVILSAYFFAAGRDELMSKVKSKLPESVTAFWHLIYDNFKAAFGGYFKAQFKIMLVLTVIMFIGFEILQVNYSFLFALGIAFLDLLPVFGTGAILWPWAIIDVVTGNYGRAMGLVVIYIICQVVKQILQPKMVGDSIGLNPLATLLFMYIGYRFYGILGLIIGVPVGMVLVKLYSIGLFDRLMKGIKIIVHDLNKFRKF